MFFYLILSFFSFTRYLNFCPKCFDRVGKRLHKKAKVNFKIYDVMNWEGKLQQTRPNISRIRGNHKNKFCQLLEYNEGNNFL